MKNICWFVLFLLLNNECFSQSTTSLLGPIIPDRPGQTNPPNVVPAGLVQLETGFSRETSKDDGVSSVNYLYNTSLVRVGLLNNCELRFIFEYARVKVDSAIYLHQLMDSILFQSGQNSQSVLKKVSFLKQPSMLQ